MISIPCAMSRSRPGRPIPGNKANILVGQKCRFRTGLYLYQARRPDSSARHFAYQLIYRYRRHRPHPGLLHHFPEYPAGAVRGRVEKTRRSRQVQIHIPLFVALICRGVDRRDALQFLVHRFTGRQIGWEYR
jgi:hypothetical protein